MNKTLEELNKFLANKEEQRVSQNKQEMLAIIAVLMKDEKLMTIVRDVAQITSKHTRYSKKTLEQSFLTLLAFMMIAGIIRL